MTNTGRYDPRYVLPFAAAALREGALEVAAAAKTGFLSMALAALAEADVAVRQLAYATLAEALAALPE
eukprot:1489930-Pyramimonas_sp.AAC.1